VTRDHAEECACWALAIPSAVALATTCTGWSSSLCWLLSGFAAGALVRALHVGRVTL